MILTGLGLDWYFFKKYELNYGKMKKINWKNLKNCQKVPFLEKKSFLNRTSALRKSFLNQSNYVLKNCL